MKIVNYVLVFIATVSLISAADPVLPNKVDPVGPNKVDPVLPNKVDPVGPNKVDPVGPNKVVPVGPGKLEPGTPKKDIVVLNSCPPQKDGNKFIEKTEGKCGAAMKGRVSHSQGNICCHYRLEAPKLKINCVDDPSKGLRLDKQSEGKCKTNALKGRKHIQLGDVCCEYVLTPPANMKFGEVSCPNADSSKGECLADKISGKCPAQTPKGFRFAKHWGYCCIYIVNTPAIKVGSKTETKAPAKQPEKNGLNKVETPKPTVGKVEEKKVDLPKPKVEEKKVEPPKIEKKNLLRL